MDARGLSTIAGTVVFIVVSLMLVALLLYAINAFDRLFSTATSSLEERARTGLTPTCLSGWWLDNGTSLVLNVSSRCPYAVALAGLTIVFNDTTLFILSPYNGTVSDGYIVIVTGSGSTTTLPLRLPVTLPAGATMNISIGGVLVGRRPAIVSLSVSASPGVAVVSLKYYYELYGVVFANVSAGVEAYRLLLERVTSSFTTSWLGVASAPLRSTIHGSVYDSEALVGSLVSGTNSSLEVVDGDLYVVEAVASIVLVNDTVVFYDDFSDDPFAGGRLVDVTGNWFYDAARDAIYTNHSLYAESSSPATVTYDDASLAYYAEMNIGNRKLYILYHVWYDGFTATYSESIIGIVSSAALAYTAGGLVYAFNTTAGAYLSMLLTANVSQGGIYGTLNETLLYSTYTDLYNSSIIDRLDPRTLYYKLLLWDAIVGNHTEFLFNETLPETVYAVTGLVDSSASEGLVGFYVYSNVTATGDQLFGGLISATGAATVNVTWYFDNVIIAEADPRFVNVSGVPAGGSVELWDGGSLVAYSNDTDGDGFVVLDVSLHPISRSPVFVVRTSTGSLLASVSPFGDVVGGRGYEFGLWAVVEARSSVNTSSIVRVYDVWLSVASNITPFLVEVWNWTRGGFDTVSGTRGVYPLDYASHVAPNGTVVYRVYVFTSSDRFVAIDCANVFIDGLFRGPASPVLAVGVGGTGYIDFYSVSLSPQPNVSYSFTLDTVSVFNGSTDFTYSIFDLYLYMINGSGLYRIMLEPGAIWELITSTCNATGGGVRLEALWNGTLVLFAVTGNDTLCVAVVDASTGALLGVDHPSLALYGPGLSVDTYSGSCVAGNNTVYFVAVNTSSSTPVVAFYNVSSGSYGVLAEAPATRVIGLACSSSSLWLLAEGGGLYRYDFSSSSWSVVDVSFPAYPWRAGDRLEYYEGYLFFVRNDDTSELWVFKPR